MIQHAHGQAWELVLLVYLIKIIVFMLLVLCIVCAHLIRDECIASDPDSVSIVVLCNTEHSK